MPSQAFPFPSWLTRCFHTHRIALWGAADLRGLAAPPDETGQAFPRALSFAVPITPAIMAAIRQGPDQAYADEYKRLNLRIKEFSNALANEIKARGYASQPLAASERTDPDGIKGDFPHKTAATRAGVGWIGKHCQLITRPYGSWVRLGTVFTDMELPCGIPIERSFCGGCRRCVDACPAKALTGCAWRPQLPREALLDVRQCDRWKKEHYLHLRKGHVCGICSAVCPYGLKTLTGAQGRTNLFSHRNNPREYTGK